MTEATITVEHKDGALIVSASLDDGTSIVLTSPDHADDQVVEDLIQAFPSAVDAGLEAFLAKAALQDADERRGA